MFVFVCVFVDECVCVYVFNLLGQRKNNVFEFFVSFCVNFMKISLKIFELKIILLFGRVLDSKLAAVASSDT